MAGRAEVPIRTEWIKLDNLLKFAGLCETGGQAKQAVADGLVRVNGEVCLMRGKKIYPETVVALEDEEIIVTKWK